MHRAIYEYFRPGGDAAAPLPECGVPGAGVACSEEVRAHMRWLRGTFGAMRRPDARARRKRRAAKGDGAVSGQLIL